jgi:hypothetical protein
VKSIGEHVRGPRANRAQHDRSHVGLRGQSLHSFRGQGTRPPGGPGRTGDNRDLSRGLPVGRTQRGPLAQLVRAHG